MHRILLCFLLPATLLSCKDKATGGDTGVVDDDSGYTSVETGVVPLDTGDDVSSDTGGDTGGDTGEPAPVVPVVGLSAWPTTLTVAPGDTYALRAVATWEDGVVADVSADWTSSDEAVATVDGAGIVTAVAPGTATLAGAYAAGDETPAVAEVGITVDDSGAVEVTVLDAATGDPIADARVRIGLEPSESGEGRTGAEGRVTLHLDASGPFTISAWDPSRVPLTVVGAVGRQLVLSLRTEAAITPASATISGGVDLSEIPSGGTGDHKIGLAMGSLQDGPLLLHPDHLLGPPKDISLYGLSAAVPGNIYARDAAEDFVLRAGEGPVHLWTLGAPLPISEVTKGLAGATDAIGLLLDHLDDVAWDFAGPFELAAGTESSHGLAPALPADRAWIVDVGALPVGFAGDEEALVMVGEDLDGAGLVPFGVGIGRFEVDVFGASAPWEGTGLPRAAAIAQVDGLGSGTGNGIVAAHAPLVDDGITTLPAFPRVPALHGFDPASHDFEIETDGRMRWVHVLIRGGPEGELREVVMDGGSVTGTLPDLAGLYPWGRTTWELLALETRGGTFQDRLRDGWPDDATLAAEAWTSGMLTAAP